MATMLTRGPDGAQRRAEPGVCDVEVSDLRRNKLTAPTWRRLSLCRVPTHRDALWCMSGGRPDESGRGRHECLRHGAKQANVKLFLRAPLRSRLCLAPSPAR